MVVLQQISKVFNRGKANEVKALQDVSITLEQGSFTVIVGVNGSGKSTLLNVISGVVQIDAGSIMLENQDITSLPEHKRSKWLARVFQNPMQGVAAELTILENFRLAALRTGNKGLKVATGNIFKAFVQTKVASLKMGLEDKINQPMGTLSGGQRQALTLLMGTMDTAQMLLLDEPTAALDPKSAATVMSLADSVVKEFGLTALMITHSLKDAHQYGDRIIQMAEGKIVRDISGAAKQNLTMPDIYQWFE